MNPKIILLLSLLLNSSLVHKASAYEVDNYSDRYSALPDARAEMNKETNRLFQEAVKRANGKRTPSCDSEVIEEAVHNHVGAFVVGTLEEYANDAPTVSKHKGRKDFIYAPIVEKSIGTKVKEFFGGGGGKKDSADQINMLAFAGINSSVNLNGNYIGTDKFGHFFDQGYSEYEKLKEAPNYEAGVTAALKYGEKSENTFFGLQATGIKSYADMSANFGGFLFWTQLTKGNNPYFRCSKGVWTQVRGFDWADYVKPSWDEAINCSDFAEKDMAARVLARAKLLETAAKKRGKSYRYTCPVSAKECVSLKAYYGKNAPALLNPKCLNAKVADNTEVEYSLQKPSNVSGNASYGNAASGGTNNANKATQKAGRK